MEDNNTEVVKLLTSINKWLRFFGWIAIITIAIWIVSSLLNLHENKQNEIQYRYENKY